MNLYLRIATAIGLLASVVSSSPAPAGENGCAPVGNLHFICGPHHPEDLVLIPGTHWILVSGMGGALPGSPPGPGDLYLLNAADKRWHSIAQASLAAVNRDTKLYGDCPAPDAAQFISHGLAIRAGSNGRHTLYAVNHGGRESVEVFAVDARAAEPRLTWTGCAVLTASAWLNSVVPLPGEGFIVTSTFDPKDPQARAKMGSGQYAGAVYQWQPGRGFAPLAGAGITGDNGVAISGDGRWLYFNWFFGRVVIRVARAGGGERATAPLDFLPDNIDYAPDGSLYVTGQNADPKQLMAGCPSGDCLHGTTIVKLDPATMKTRVIARLPPNATFSDGTTALQVGDTIFLGSYRGDAVAYMKAPK
ncbi:MAG: hypothetical protein ACHQDD_05525 [Steroidobacterales bacterium]